MTSPVKSVNGYVYLIPTQNDTGTKTPAHSIGSKSGFYRSIRFSYTVVYSTTVAMLLGIESPAALVAMTRYCISIPRGWSAIVMFPL